MQVWEGVILAMQQLRSEKLKSFFSLIGVILGVMFLIVVVTIIEGLDRYVREEVTSQVFGVSTVTLRRWPEVDINTEITNDKNKNNLVHSIVANGYKLTLKSNEIQYIKKALVKVYEYNNANNDNKM